MLASLRTIDYWLRCFKSLRCARCQGDWSFICHIVEKVLGRIVLFIHFLTSWREILFWLRWGYFLENGFRYIEYGYVSCLIVGYVRLRCIFDRYIGKFFDTA